MERPDDLAALAEAEEVLVASTKKDGTPIWLPIWLVRVHDELYARSFDGPEGRWFRAALDDGRTRLRLGELEREADVTAVGEALRAEIDAAYAAKYGEPPTAEFVPAMTDDLRAATTLRIELR